MSQTTKGLLSSTKSQRVRYLKINRPEVISWLNARINLARRYFYLRISRDQSTYILAGGREIFT